MDWLAIGDIGGRVHLWLAACAIGIVLSRALFDRWRKTRRSSTGFGLPFRGRSRGMDWFWLPTAVRTPDPKISGLERTVWTVLDHLGVSYESQVRIGRMTVDLLIPDRNLVIEVDGCYWHGCTKCGTPSPNGQADADKRRDYILRKKGYRVARIRECDLEKNLFNPVREALR
jgi:very-short-patch-repair endonuclease